MNKAMDSPTKQPRLCDLLVPQTIRLRIRADNWQEAADYLGELLLNAGAITQTYIGAMKRVVSEMGPYAVIAPGVALLHARPEDGVIRPSMGLVTLNPPVPFGSSVNDPVEFVFAFGATEKKSHVRALQILARLLGSPEFKTRLRSARSSLDAHRAIADLEERLVEHASQPSQ